MLTATTAQGVDCSSALQQLAGELQELKGVSSSTYVWVVSLLVAGLTPTTPTTAATIRTTTSSSIIRSM